MPSLSARNGFRPHFIVVVAAAVDVAAVTLVAVVVVPVVAAVVSFWLPICFVSGEKCYKNVITR